MLPLQGLELEVTGPNGSKTPIAAFLILGQNVPHTMKGTPPVKHAISMVILDVL